MCLFFFFCHLIENDGEMTYKMMIFCWKLGIRCKQGRIESASTNYYLVHVCHVHHTFMSCIVFILQIIFQKIFNPKQIQCEIWWKKAKIVIVKTEFNHKLLWQIHFCCMRKKKEWKMLKTNHHNVYNTLLQCSNKTLFASFSVIRRTRHEWCESNVLYWRLSFDIIFGSLEKFSIHQ